MNRDHELLLAFLKPIEALLRDESVTEIMGNPDGSWWYEREGRLHAAESVTFEARALRTSLEVIASRMGRKLDDAHPLLNVQLPDGSRLAAVLPPIVRPAPSVTVRKFATARYTLEHLIDAGVVPHGYAEYLAAAVRDGRTILISGGTGSGKTTLMGALTEFIPDSQRLVVIEDTSELRIDKPNVLAAECQTDAHGATVDFDTLLRGALRWRPDRIILGEVRGAEARTLLDSFNTGHAGSMATIHASSALRALGRFGELAMRSHQQATRDDIATEIADSVQVVVQVQRSAAGRQVNEIVSVEGYSRERKAFDLRTIYDRREASPWPRTTQLPNPQETHRHAAA